jgi:hypothetical protein
MKMKKIKYCRITIMTLLCFMTTHLFAQSGMMGNNPNKSAALDLNATNKGILIPQVNLQSTADVSTIANPAISLLIYNNNAGITGTGAKGAGYYFYDGTIWKKLIQAPDIVGDNLGNHIATQDLNMQANKVYFDNSAGPKLEFLGGQDAAGICLDSNYNTVFLSGEKNTVQGIFSWSNYGGTAKDVLTERMRLTGPGNLGIGTTNPSAMLHVVGNAQIDQQLLVKNLLPAGPTDKVVTADNNGLIKVSTTSVSSILQTCTYSMPQVANGASQSVTLNSSVKFFMFTVTTSNSCGKQFSATYMVKNGVLFYLNMGSTTYVSTVNDPNGNSLKMTVNIGTACSSDTAQVNYIILLNSNVLTIQNTNTSTNQDYSIDMIQLG